MTMKRGEQWGVTTTRTSDDVMVKGDNELVSSSTHDRIMITGGDIARSLGNPSTPLVGSSCIEVPIDALRVVITLKDGTTHTTIAASHVIIGSWLRGRLICVSNGGFIGSKNVSPRAHPNDGFFDVMSLDETMGLQQRLLARHKSILGTHTPHPLIKSSRNRSIEHFSNHRSEHLHIDGRRIRSWTCVQVEIVPDYWRVLV
jgi:hypothetical protein